VSDVMLIEPSSNRFSYWALAIYKLIDTGNTAKHV
jgi:hypothetical protein